MRFSKGVALSAAVFAAAALSTWTSAVAEPVEFRGGGYLRGFSEACKEKGFGEAVYVDAVFRPRMIGSNGNATRISFFFPQFYATSYELPRGRLTRKFKRVVGGATASATYFFDKGPQMRVTEKSPGRVRKGTRAVSLAGEIRNFDGIKGCVAEFELSLHRQP